MSERATHQGRYKRTENEVWRPDAGPENTAPDAGATPPAPRVEDWGVTVEEARAMLGRQMCPVCGEGPWKSPLNHASRKHAIDRFTMRDVCGLTLGESVLDPETRERFVEHGRNTDMSKVNSKGKPRAKQRWTRAGRQKNAETLAAWEAANPDEALAQKQKAARERTPERSQRQSEAQKQWWAEHPEAREAARKRLAESLPPPEEQSRLLREAWRQRGTQPCGTRASYRRGCRCDECRTAYLAYRKEHG